MALTQISKDGVKADLIDGTKIADNAINSEHYTDGSIDTAHIAADQITGALIADDAVGAEHIEDLDADVKWLDSKKAIFGTGDDLQIYHDPQYGHSWIKESGGGGLEIATSMVEFYNAAIDEKMLTATENGAVELYYDGVKKFETTSSGVDCSDQFQCDGTIFGTGGIQINADNQKLRIGAGEDLTFEHTGTSSKINNTTGALYIQSDTLSFHGEGGSETTATFTKDGAVELYYNNSKKFETQTSGVTITGFMYIPDSDGSDNMIRLGNGADLQLYHNGTNSIIDDTGSGALIIRTDNALDIKDSDNVMMAAFNKDADVKLYHDGSVKLETSANGVVLSDYLYLNVDGKEIRMGAGEDLRLWHGGSHSYITNSTGTLYFKSDTLSWNSSDGENIIWGTKDAEVRLFYNNVKKFETTNDGVAVTGRLKMATNPYFHVRLDGNQTGYNGNTTTSLVEFDYEQQDLGGNFNTSTHLFTAPCNGIYSFIGSTVANESNSTQAWLVVNGSREQYSDWVQNGASSIMCSHHVVKLASGDTVGYHLHTADTSCTINENEWHTWFKGYLVYET